MEPCIESLLQAAGYDWALAIATVDEIQNGAACGQLAIISDD